MEFSFSATLYYLATNGSDVELKVFRLNFEFTLQLNKINACEIEIKFERIENEK